MSKLSIEQLEGRETFFLSWYPPFYNPFTIEPEIIKKAGLALVKQVLQDPDSKYRWLCKSEYGYFAQPKIREKSVWIPYDPNNLDEHAQKLINALESLYFPLFWICPKEQS